MYAEDFYSGGDFVAPAAAELTPNHLTPAGMSPVGRTHADSDRESTISPSPADNLPSHRIHQDDSLPKSSPPAVEDVDDGYEDQLGDSGPEGGSAGSS